MPRTENPRLPASLPPTVSSLSGDSIPQLPVNSCLPPLKELRAQAGALDSNLPENENDW